jgi:hypothetical protein
VFVDRSGQQVAMTPRQTNLTDEPVGMVTLKPGQFANATIGIPNPQNFQSTAELSSSTCRPVATTALRISPPGQQAVGLLAFDAEVCTTADGAPVLTPFRAGRAPTAVG